MFKQISQPFRVTDRAAVFGGLVGVVLLWFGTVVRAEPPEEPPSEGRWLPAVFQLPGHQEVVPEYPWFTTTGLQEPAAGEAAPEQPRDLLELSLEQLAAQPVRVPGPVAAAAPLALEQLVTTVERQASTVRQSPAAVFVITPEMIQRSGAAYLPEVFRMVPGMDVARFNASQWAINIRGFNDRFSNNLMVQIDGRTIYTPLFGGVFWEAQDVFLQDVERIEVIRGPGASVWGSNAVNGIINILSKSAKDTQGVMIFGGGGSEKLGFSGVRYGGQLGDNAYFRVWGKQFEHGPSFNALVDPRDDWRDGRGGFRLDWEANEQDTLTLQGDIFDNHDGLIQAVPKPNPPAPFFAANAGDFHFSGGDVLCRWRRELGEKSDCMVQFYYDRFDVLDPDLAGVDQDILDLDFQQQFPLSTRQQLIYGLGYRYYKLADQRINPFVFQFVPQAPEQSIASAFVQDEISLVPDRLAFTAGSKFEYNTFVGFLVEPTGRLLFTPSERQSGWAAVSRALRTPTYGSEKLFLTVLPPNPDAPFFPRLDPSPGLKSEVLLAYEVGYRAQLLEKLSWDLALFVNDYSGLALNVPGQPTGGPLPAPVFIPVSAENRMQGETYGVELAATWTLTDWWRLYGQYTYLQMQLHADPSLPEEVRAGAEAAEGQSPHNQVYAQSSWDLGRKLQLDLITRYVDNLPAFTPVIGSYMTLSARLGWRPNPNMEVAVVGQDLIDSPHPEFGANPLAGTISGAVQRSVYGMVTCRW